MDELLDTATYNGMKELLEDEFPSFLEIFFSESQEALDKIDSGLENNDASIIKAAAHNLKSSSGYIGAVKLAELSSHIEAQASTGSIDNISAMFAESQCILGKLKTNLT